MKSNYKILITTGDTDGIGLEVTVKALLKIGPQKNINFYYFKQAGNQESLAKKLVQKFKRLTVNTWAEALKIPLSSHRQIIEINSLQSPAAWVETAALACKTKAAQGLVTAPLSKTCIKSAGLSDIGHTDILKRICGSPQAFMGFAGKKFNVVLATGHVPLSVVTSDLNSTKLRGAIAATDQLKPLLSKKQSDRPIAVLGLNPHAGDSGLIGKEEELWLRAALDEISLTEKRRVVGPLPPDSAFLKENWEKYSCFVALYHDQGLIPFKMIHGFDSGVHITLGLPIVRTSVDHGTAKDIFGKNKANANSMVAALLAARDLVR